MSGDLGNLNDMLSGGRSVMDEIIAPIQARADDLRRTKDEKQVERRKLVREIEKLDEEINNLSAAVQLISGRKAGVRPSTRIERDAAKAEILQAIQDSGDGTAKEHELRRTLGYGDAFMRNVVLELVEEGIVTRAAASNGAGKGKGAFTLITLLPRSK